MKPRANPAKTARKIAVTFVIAVLAPSIVLAWLSIRSLKSQELVFERQQEVLMQAQSDATAEKIRTAMNTMLHEFEAKVDILTGTGSPKTLAPLFDRVIRNEWPMAEIGFAVSMSGELLAPAKGMRQETADFLKQQAEFLTNEAPARVYQTQIDDASLKLKTATPAPQSAMGLGNFVTRGQAQPSDGVSRKRTSMVATEGTPAAAKAAAPSRTPAPAAIPSLAPAPSQPMLAKRAKPARALQENGRQYERAGEDAAPVSRPETQTAVAPAPKEESASFLVDDKNRKDSEADRMAARDEPAKKDQKLEGASDSDATLLRVTRNVVPEKELHPASGSVSNLVPTEAEFRQIVGDAGSGSIARFIENKLQVLLWHRSATDPEMVFGVRLNLDKLRASLSELVNPAYDLRDVCLALLDDTGAPVALPSDGFKPADWRRPFVATEVGDILPHWEVAAYLRDPGQFSRNAATIRRSLGLLIAGLVAAIGIGSWLIVLDVRQQLLLARQKTDFVSNVSHELKTPLTSIRMFSELLSEGKVADPSKQRQYSRIIESEASRLTRLINNVLDFARMERNEKRYDRAPFSLRDLVEDTCSHYRPHLEANGYRLTCEAGDQSLELIGDRDAISQVLVNLVSNAEKYGGDAKEIAVTLTRREGNALIQVLDRGPGVPRGAEKKIFEQFYRAHDSLNSGIQGAGLGLTLARQIARSHGGDVGYAARAGGGSCFEVRLPISNA